MTRIGIKERTTNETRIKLTINLDGSGKATIDTTIPFLDHMLELFARHGQFDLELSAKGDTHIDLHHTVEDVGIALGEAVACALSDKKGIRRYGSIVLPMDEALVTIALDLGGRAYFKYHKYMPGGLHGTIEALEEVKIAQKIAQQLEDKIKGVDLELIAEFFKSFANNCQANLHIILHYGENLHHIIEGMFKAFGRVLDEASRLDERLKGQIPSTKGTL
jgi:imidazoleglycerol-phosphate dehydratase